MAQPPGRFEFPCGLGRIDLGEKGGRIVLDLPFFDKKETQWGKPPTPPSWADKLGNFFKTAGYIVLAALCAVVALALLPFTVAGIMCKNVGEDVKQNIENPMQAHELRVWGRIMAFAYYGAKDFLQDAGLIAIDPTELAWRALDAGIGQAKKFGLPPHI